MSSCSVSWAEPTPDRGTGGDNEQQQQLEQQIFNADTDQFYNAAAV